MKRVKCNRFIVLLLVELLILLVFLPGCFRPQQAVFTVEGSEVTENTTAEEGFLDYCSEYLTLEPGVYRIYVESNLTEGQRLSVEMACEETTFQSLRSNVAWILSGENHTDFEVYVSDEIDNAYLHCCFYGAEGTALVQLEVCKTGIGNGLVMAIALAVFAVLDGLIWFRRRILDGKVNTRQQIAFWGLTAVVVLAYFPFLANCIYLGTETLFHLERIAHLKDALLQGTSFPMRIQGTWLYGHGYAVSYFCSDLWLLFPALLMVIGFPLMHAYMIYVLVVLALTAWVAYTCIRKCVRDEYGALFGSAIYMLAPCYLLNLYGYGAVGEFTAMAFLPLVLCGIYLLLTEAVTAGGYGKYKWYLVGGLTGALHSSVSFTVLITAIVGIAGLVFLKRTFRRQTLVQLLQVVGIVLLVNAWFWFPMLYMLGGDTYHLHQVSRITDVSSGTALTHSLQLLGTPLVALLGAFFVKKVLAGTGTVTKALLAAIVGIIVMSSVYHVNRIGFETMPTFLYEEENIGTAIVGDGAFLPAETEVTQMSYHEPVAEEGLRWSDYARKGNEVTIYLENPTGMECYLELPILGYEGYDIEAEGAGDVPYIAEETGAHGDLRVGVPAGYSGRILVSYEGVGIFRVAEMISLFSVVAIPVIYWYDRRKKAQDDK